jgi:LuxR family transcriptional regulator, maltose regulon positive regulatory protein
MVARTALVGRLLATHAPFITVVAPPGYGKTTLLAQWAGRIGPRVAWVSCDDADDDPVVLLSALAAALDRVEPVDQTVYWALASSGAGITVVPRFVSAIASVRPPVNLVLDHMEAVTNKQCLDTIAEFAPAPAGGMAPRAGFADRCPAAHGPAACPRRDHRAHRRRSCDEPA